MVVIGATKQLYFLDSTVGISSGPEETMRLNSFLNVVIAKAAVILYFLGDWSHIFVNWT